MGIQPIKSNAVASTDIADAAGKSAEASSGESQTPAALYGDVLILGADSMPVYTTYTQTGDYADSTIVSNSATSDAAATSDDTSTTETTDDEKWQKIVSKYSDEPMTLKNYSKMLNDLCNAGILTQDDWATAVAAASSRAVGDSVELDLQNGILGDEDYLSGYTLDFSQLLDDLDDTQSKYYNADNNQSAFLQKLYSKLSESMKQN